MRIVIISDQAQAKGGAEALAILSARLLAEAGHDVTFFSGDEGSAPELVAAGVHVIGVGGSHVREVSRLRGFTNGLYYPPARRALTNWIESHDDGDVVYHVHSWSKFLSPALFAALKPVTARTLIHAHDFFMLCPNGAFMDYRAGHTCGRDPLSLSCISTNCDKRSYAQKLWRVARHEIRHHYFDIASAPSRILLVHPGMAPFFHHAGVETARLHVLRNPVVPPSEARVAAEINHEILFVGRLDQEKGTRDAALAARDANLTLRIVGDGPEREKLQAEFPECLFEGWCAPETVTSHLRQARLLVVPSRWRETFGMVVVEALRLGVPVVISQEALIGPDLAESSAGLVTDTTDIAGFANLLKRLDADDSAVAAMSANAQPAARRLGLNEAEWCDQLVSHYSGVLAIAVPSISAARPRLSPLEAS